MPPAMHLDWRELAARASRLDERLRGEVSLDDETPASPAVVEARLARWRELAGDGDESRFTAVLASHGLDHRTARQALGAVRLPRDAPLPGWTRTARRLAALSWQERRFSPAPAEPDLRTIFTPALRLARRTLRRVAGPAVCRQLRASAHRDLEAYLLRRLERIGNEVFACEFCIHRSLTNAWDQRPPPSERTERQEFLRVLRQRGGLAELFRLFPVFARLCSETVDAWVRFSAEFLRRLARDRREIQHRFFAGPDQSPLRRMHALEAGAGDEHRGGRSVLILHFSGDRGDQRLVYKPRDLGVDLAWFNLLEGVNAEGIPHPLRPVKVWPRGKGYGWMEFIPASPPQDEPARARYGWRAGALACLFHALSGTDGHRGNLVKAGDQPVLVDLETLLHAPDPEHQSPWPLAETVFRTALLPLPGGVGNGGEPGSPPQAPRWTFPPAFGTPGAHPRLDVDAGELLAGFRAVTRLLTAPRMSSGLRKRFRQLTRKTVRRVVLPTALYDLLLRRSLAAGCLREGVDRSLEFEFLRRSSLGENRREPWIGEEIRALERLDIPYFTAVPPGTGGGEQSWLPPAWFRRTDAGENPRAPTETLNQHLEAQIRLLEQTYAASPVPRGAVKLTGPG